MAWVVFRQIAALSLGFPILLVGTAAGAQSSADECELGAARQAYTDGDLFEAYHQFQLLLREGGCPSTSLAEIYRSLGILSLARDDRAAAEQNFRFSLTLQPNQEVPAELPPRGRELFERARTGIQGPIGVHGEAVEVRRDEPTLIRASVERDPTGLCDHVRAQAGEESVRGACDGAQLMSVPIGSWTPAGASVNLSVHDAHGNAVATSVLSVDPPPATDPLGTPQTSSEGGVDDWVVALLTGAGILVAAAIAVGVGVGVTQGGDLTYQVTLNY